MWQGAERDPYARVFPHEEPVLMMQPKGLSCKHKIKKLFSTNITKSFFQSISQELLPCIEVIRTSCIEVNVYSHQPPHNKPTNEASTQSSFTYKQKLNANVTHTLFPILV